MLKRLCFFFIICLTAHKSLALVPPSLTKAIADKVQQLHPYFVNLNQRMTEATHVGAIDVAKESQTVKSIIASLSPLEQALVFYRLLDSYTAAPLELTELESWSFWTDLDIKQNTALLSAIYTRFLAIKGPSCFYYLTQLFPHYFKRNARTYAYQMQQPYELHATIVLRVLAELYPWRAEHFLQHTLKTSHGEPLSQKTIQAIMQRGDYLDITHGPLKLLSLIPTGNAWNNSVETMIKTLTTHRLKVSFPQQTQIQADTNEKAFIDASYFVNFQKNQGYRFVKVLGRTLLFEHPDQPKRYLALKLMKKSERAQDLAQESQMMDHVSQLEELNFSLEPYKNSQGKRLASIPIQFLKQFEKLPLDELAIQNQAAIAFPYTAPQDAFVYLDEIADDRSFIVSAIANLKSLGTMASYGLFQTEPAAFNHNTEQGRPYRWMVDVLPSWTYRFGSGRLDRVLAQSRHSNFRSQGIIMDYGSVFDWSHTVETMNNRLRHETPTDYQQLPNTEAFVLTDLLGHYFLSWAMVVVSRTQRYPSASINLGQLLHDGWQALSQAFLRQSLKETPPLEHFQTMAKQLCYFVSEQAVQDIVAGALPKQELGLSEHTHIDMPSFPKIQELDQRQSTYEWSQHFPSEWVAIVVQNNEGKPIDIHHLGWMRSLAHANINHLRELLHIPSLAGPFFGYDKSRQNITTGIVLTVSDKEENLKEKLAQAFERLKFEFLDSGASNGTSPLQALIQHNYQLAPSLVLHFAKQETPYDENEKQLQFMWHQFITGPFTSPLENIQVWIEKLYLTNYRFPFATVEHLCVNMAQFLSNITLSSTNDWSDNDKELIATLFKNIAFFVFTHHPREQGLLQNTQSGYMRLIRVLPFYIDELAPPAPANKITQYRQQENKLNLHA